MHQVYTTEAFVISSTPHGEAGKFLLLFTKDFGMIGATAAGVRLSQSKLKFHLQDANFSNVSLVRGKEVWRITGASGLEYEKPTILHLKILKLLKRLLTGEEKNEELFYIIEILYKTKILESHFELVECLILLRILNTLGYVHNNELTKTFLENNMITEEILKEVKNHKLEIIKVINQALSESQL